MLQKFKDPSRLVLFLGHSTLGTGIQQTPGLVAGGNKEVGFPKEGPRQQHSCSGNGSPVLFLQASGHTLGVLREHKVSLGDLHFVMDRLLPFISLVLPGLSLGGFFCELIQITPKGYEKLREAGEGE